jgi:hypothetical protein
VSNGKADTSSAVPLTVKGGARWHDPDSDAREDRVQAESDQEADDFQEGEGKETASQVLAHYILRWRRWGEPDQTCRKLDELFLDHPPHDPAQPPAPSPERQMDVMRARVIFGTTKEFVFCQGVQTPRAPNGAPASEEALHWLATKARDNPVQRIKGVDGFLPHTREVLRRILANVYNPTRLSDLQGPARGGAMADLEGRFAFRTKGLAQDFESNVYNGTVILHMGHQGSTATVDLEKRLTAEAREQHHTLIDGLLTGEKDFATLSQAQQASCAAKAAKRYALLHPAVPMQLRVFIQPRIMEDGTKRYFQLEMDPMGPGVLPIAQVLAGDPNFRINKDTGALEGCYFAFIADFSDPQGTLRAETLNSFGRVDSYAACHAVNNFDPIPQGHTRAGLLVYMGAIPASLRHDADQWQRRWVLLDDCRVVPFYYNPQGTYRLKELAANEYPLGIHTSHGHCQEQRKVVGPYSEFAAIIQNEPLKLHKDGTRVCTALSRAEDLGMVILDKPLRHWALHKRPAHLPLPAVFASFSARVSRWASSSTR